MKKLQIFYKFCIYTSLTILILSIGITLFQNTDLNYLILKKSAEFGTYFLFLMLSLKSIYFILKNLKYTNNSIYKALRTNNIYKRDQGLIVFNIIFIHIIMLTIMNISNIKTLIFYYLSAIIPTIILVYMEITSFKFFQTKIKRWKKHHSLIWLIIPLVVLHVFLVSTHKLIYLFLGIVLLQIAFLEKLFKLKRGGQHLLYIIIGLGISTTQYFATEQYTSNKNKSELSSDQYEQNTSNSKQNQNSLNSSNIQDDTQVTSTLYEDGTYTGQGYGHKGLIEVETTIEDDQIISIEVVTQNEDEPWWEPVINTLPEEIINNNSTDSVDYIAGSTHSSEGFLNAVDNSLNDAKI